MGISLSGGLYQYNRFDEYENSLEEGKGASTPEEMKKKVEAAGRKTKKETSGYSKVDKEEEAKEEVDTAMGEGFNPAGSAMKVQSGMNKQVLGVADQASSLMKGGNPMKSKQPAAKAASKAMGEGYKPLPKEKMARQITKTRGAEDRAARAGDEAGTNKLMKRRIAMEMPAGRKAQLMKKEEVEHLDEISKELATKAYAERRTNEVEADQLHTKSNKTRKRIVNKHGEKAGKDADKAAHKTLYGEDVELEEKTVAPGENLARRKLNSSDNATKEKLQAKIMENDQRMAMYSRALGVMGAHYSGPGFGVGASNLEERKKDDEPTDERKAAADRSAEAKRQKKEGKKGEAHETEEIEKNEDKDLKKGRRWQDDDGDGKWYEKGEVKEAVGAIAAATKVLGSAAAKGAAKTAGKAALTSAATTAGERAGTAAGNIGKKNESVQGITKDDVVEFLVNENYATNPVSAEALFNHMSDEFLLQIEGRIEEGYNAAE